MLQKEQRTELSAQAFQGVVPAWRSMLEQVHAVQNILMTDNVASEVVAVPAPAVEQNDEGDHVGGSDANIDEEECLDPVSEAFFNALYDAKVHKTLDKKSLTKKYSEFVRSRIVDGYSRAEAKAEAMELMRGFAEALKAG
jgi:hypothetical protein